MFDTKRNERFGPPPEPYERALQSEQRALEASKSPPSLGVNQELDREEHRKLEPYRHAFPENSHENLYHENPSHENPVYDDDNGYQQLRFEQGTKRLTGRVLLGDIPLLLAVNSVL